MRPDLSDGGEMGEIKPAGRTGDRNVNHVPPGQHLNPQPQKCFRELGKRKGLCHVEIIYANEK